MGKGEVAMAQRGGGEEGRANTKLGEGHLSDEDQQGDQQQNPQVSKTVLHQLLTIISLHLLHEQKLKEFPSPTREIDQHSETFSNLVQIFSVKS